MLLKGNQRGGAKDLALHLMKDENEVVEIHQIRGFLSHDLMGALNEIYAISRGTRCKQFMYSLSINPPQDEYATLEDFLDAIEQAEKRLGLEGQPRIVVFHEKIGKDGKLRKHCHVVWSRIDIMTMTARRMSYDHEKLNDLSYELFRQHGWKVPEGFKDREKSNSTNYTHAEHQQAKRVGKDAAEIKADIQAAWEASDTKIAFEHALAEKGYFLARGDRGRFVLVDEHGEVYSLRQILRLKVKELRAKLGDEQDLPSVQDILDRLTLERDVKPIYDAEKALVEIARYHAAFTTAMMDRTLKPIIKDKLQRNAVIQEILQSPDIVHIGEHDGKDVFTTKTMLDIEKRMAENAQEMAHNLTHPIDSHAVHRAIFNLNNKLAIETNGKASLSREQTDALHHMVSSKQLSLVVGVAGAGKTTIMEGAKEALESEGYRVRGAAPSGVAAASLTEIGMNASTLHALEYRIKLAQKILEENEGKPLTPRQTAFIKSAILTNKDVLIVDEAGMVSAKQLANIIELTKQAGAKLVLVGDPAQLQSVEAGAAFRTLLERNSSMSLTEVRRQKTDWQCEATIDLSKGNIADALKAYDQHDCIIQAKNRDAAKTALVEDVMQAQKAAPEASRLVLAYTRKDVAELNTMIKAEMVRKGNVSEHNIDTQITVKDGDIERQEIQGFALGDRILFRQNDTNMGVMNGTFGTLKNVENGQFYVELDNGKSVAFSPKEYSYFQLGYATTVHKSQGVTVDQTFVLATPHFDRHTSYVALSRHKEDVKLYANRKDFKTDARLHRSLGKEGEKLSTLDFTDKKEKVIEPEQPKQESSPSFFDRLKSFFANKPEPAPKQQPPAPQNQPSGHWMDTQEIKIEEQSQIPTRNLNQQEFVKLRDEFMQKAEMVEAKNTIDHEPQQDYSPKLDR